MKRQAETPDQKNLLLKKTYEDAKSIAGRKHPKALYIECLKNSPFWRHYSASDSFTEDDMSMYLCKNIGCAINYCSLVKQDFEALWKNSSDCSKEIKLFNQCMVAERQRYRLLPERPESLYDYIQQRLVEK